MVGYTLMSFDRSPLAGFCESRLGARGPNDRRGSLHSITVGERRNWSWDPAMRTPSRPLSLTRGTCRFVVVGPDGWVYTITSHGELFRVNPDGVTSEYLTKVSYCIGLHPAAENGVLVLTQATGTSAARLHHIGSDGTTLADVPFLDPETEYPFECHQWCPTGEPDTIVAIVYNSADGFCVMKVSISGVQWLFNPREIVVGEGPPGFGVVSYLSGETWKLDESSDPISGSYGIAVSGGYVFWHFDTPNHSVEGGIVTTYTHPIVRLTSNGGPDWVDCPNEVGGTYKTFLAAPGGSGFFIQYPFGGGGWPFELFGTTTVPCGGKYGQWGDAVFAVTSPGAWEDNFPATWLIPAGVFVGAGLGTVVHTPPFAELEQDPAAFWVSGSPPDGPQGAGTYKCDPPFMTCNRTDVQRNVLQVTDGLELAWQWDNGQKSHDVTNAGSGLIYLTTDRPPARTTRDASSRVPLSRIGLTARITPHTVDPVQVQMPKAQAETDVTAFGVQEG